VALPYELHLAQRDLARYPWLTLAMTLGLSVAVLVMAYIPSTMTSFYEDMIDRIVEQNSPHVTVWPHERREGQVDRGLRGVYGDDAVLALSDHTSPRSHDLNGYHAVTEQVASVPGVAAVAAFAQGNATASRGRTDLGIELEGIQPIEYSRVVNIASHFPEQRVPKLGPADVAIGFRAAEKLGVATGDHIRIATAQTQMLMRIRAIFRSGYYDKDLYHMYVSLPTAQRMLRMGNEVSGLAARCDDIQQTLDISQAIRARTNLRIRNWRDDNASLLAEISMVKRITAFINVLVALVAAAGMANVFSVYVLNRQKELAIMRAVGASRASLRVILLLEAMFIWVVGTVVGCTAVLGLMAYEQAHPMAVSAETYGIGSYATQPQTIPFVLAVSLAALTMAGSAWWSGRKAAHLSPAEVIFGR
jgi:lipoprotein-releasing system permease protein